MFILPITCQSLWKRWICMSKYNQWRRTGYQLSKVDQLKDWGYTISRRTPQGNGTKIGTQVVKMMGRLRDIRINSLGGVTSIANPWSEEEVQFMKILLVKYLYSGNLNALSTSWTWSFILKYATLRSMERKHYMETLFDPE